MDTILFQDHSLGVTITNEQVITTSEKIDTEQITAFTFHRSSPISHFILNAPFGDGDRSPISLQLEGAFGKRGLCKFATKGEFQKNHPAALAIIKALSTILATKLPIATKPQSTQKLAKWIEDILGDSKTTHLTIAESFSKLTDLWLRDYIPGLGAIAILKKIYYEQFQISGTIPAFDSDVAVPFARIFRRITLEERPRFYSFCLTYTGKQPAKLTADPAVFAPGRWIFDTSNLPHDVDRLIREITPQVTDRNEPEGESCFFWRMINYDPSVGHRKLGEEQCVKAKVLFEYQRLFGNYNHTPGKLHAYEVGRPLTATEQTVFREFINHLIPPPH